MGFGKLVLAFLVALALPVLAQTPTPEQIVRGIYAGGGARSTIDQLRDPRNRAWHFAPNLVRLLNANDREECIDFGLHINGQDFDEAEIARTLRFETRMDGDRAVVDARFRNFRIANHIRFDFVRVGDGWQIADIASLASDARWRLSTLRCGNGVPGSLTASPAAGEPSRALAALRRPGRHCFANRSSELSLTVDRDGAAQVAIDHVASNPQAHLCHLEAPAQPTAEGWRVTSQGDAGLCRLDLVVAPSGRMTLRDERNGCKNNHCGHAAYLADVSFNLARDRRQCR
jgi:hypothetical protein